jgi:hypothetical protein
MLDPSGDNSSLQNRLEQLEGENERLRDKLAMVDPALARDNPCFDPKLFLRSVQISMGLGMGLAYGLAGLLVMAAMFTGFGRTRIGPVAVMDVGGMNSRILPGFGLGLVAIGGGAAGVVAIGGMAVGIVAIGGGAIGVVAVGGGSFGVFAFGGGAVGYIAIGGGAAGCYAMAQRAGGTHVLSLSRQDPEAVALFIKFVPGLRAAVTTAMPVILLQRKSEG